MTFFWVRATTLTACMCFCIFSCIIFSASFASSIQLQSSQPSPNKSDTVSFSLQSRPFVHFETNNVESFFPLTEHTIIEWNNEGLHTPSTELTSLMCWICIDWFNFALCFTLAIEVLFLFYLFFSSADINTSLRKQTGRKQPISTLPAHMRTKMPISIHTI